MKIELRNVKHAAFASEETECFQATVYIDGKRAGTASNEGRGGATWIEPPSLNDMLDRHARTLPQITTTAGGKDFSYDATGETLIDDLLDAWLTERDLKRLLKKVTLKVAGDPPGTFRTFAATLKPTPENLARVATKNPGAVILNSLPWAEALAIYKEKQA